MMLSIYLFLLITMIKLFQAGELQVELGLF